MFQRNGFFTRRFTQNISLKTNNFWMNKEGAAVVGSIFIGLGYSAYTNNLLNPVLNYLSEINELRLINNKLQDDFDLVLLEDLNNKMHINNNKDELNILENKIIELLKKIGNIFLKLKLEQKKC